MRSLSPLDLVPGLMVPTVSNEAEALVSGQHAESVGPNIFPIVANYYSNLVFARRPDMRPSEDAMRAIRESAWYRAVYGWGVVVRQGDRHWAVNPIHWWPIVVRGVRVGSIIIQPYRSSSNGGFDFGMPDRAHVVVAWDYLPEASVQEWSFSGNSLGNVLSSSPVFPVRIGVWGDGRSDVMAAKWAGLEYGRRIASVRDVLNRFAHPHIQVPSSMVERGPDGESSVKLSAKGSAIPVGPTDKEVKYVSFETGAGLARLEIDEILNSISIVTAIPRVEFGQSNPAPRVESGSGVAGMLWASRAKARLWEADLIAFAESLRYVLRWPDDTLKQSDPTQGAQDE